MSSVQEPDFESFGREDWLKYWSSTGDHAAFVRWMMRTGQRGSEADQDMPATRLIAVRIPVDMVERLDELTAGSKEGRSGLIRLGVQELLKKIDESQTASAA